jgi:hypothetical protein
MPHAAEAPSAAAVSAPNFRVHQMEPAIARKKILLLEDDAAFKEIMTDFLAENQCDVVAVQNGVEGVHEVWRANSM